MATNHIQKWFTITRISSLPPLFAFLTFLLLTGSRITAAPPLPQARVIAVNDGDTVTIRMNGREYRTRLIGIDAPETGQQPWGPKAREHLRKTLKESQWRVSVETDIERFDRYNRLLVYLWSENKKLINEQMLLDGYSVLFTMQPNSRYVARLRKAQRIAREKKLGIWGPDGLKERPSEYKKKHPREQESSRGKTNGSK